MTTLPDSPKQPRLRPISKAVKNAIKYMASHRVNIKTAAEKHGICRETLSKNLARPHVQEYRDEVVRRTLGNAALIAAGQLKHLSTEARSEYVQLNASSEVLNRAGFSDQPKDTGPTTAIQINIDLG